MKYSDSPRPNNRMVDILDDILDELLRAEEKHPDWPADLIHAAAILGEESGELTQAALDHIYAGGDIERIRQEAIQCGAMAVRLLLNLPASAMTTG